MKRLIREAIPRNAAEVRETVFFLVLAALAIIRTVI